MTKPRYPHGALYPDSPDPLFTIPDPSSPNTEKTRSVDQKLPPRWQRIFGFLDARRPLLAVQGAIVATWRTYRGKRLGPYYRLAYREKGRQRSLYLGCCVELVERVRDAMGEIQGRLREGQVMRRLIHTAKETLSACKDHLRRQLATIGIQMKGFEMRGVRAACARGFRPIVSPMMENPAIGPPPLTFVPPVRPGLRAWLWQAINERALANEAAMRKKGIPIT